MRQQRSIARAVAVQGFGYWSGEDVTVEFRPAPAHSGIVFVRGDLRPAVRVEARVAHRVEMPRRTTLVAHGAAIEMVEHVLAACAGLQVDNCEIWLDRPELPGCDGSSLRFVEALLEAGIVEQEIARATHRVRRTIRVGDEQAWVEARPSDRACLSLHYELDYGSDSAIGRQQIGLDLTPAVFTEHLARARTFLLQAEAEFLREQGLGRRVSYADLLVFNCRGPLQNDLRFPDECVRHKTLDLVGDLALAGCDLLGHVVAYRSGHRLNAELVRELLAQDEVGHGRRKSA